MSAILILINHISSSRLLTQFKRVSSIICYVKCHAPLPLFDNNDDNANPYFLCSPHKACTRAYWCQPLVTEWSLHEQHLVMAFSTTCVILATLVSSLSILIISPYFNNIYNKTTIQQTIIDNLPSPQRKKFSVHSEHPVSTSDTRSCQQHQLGLTDIVKE